MAYTNFNEDPARGLLPGDDLKDMLEEFSTMTDIGMKASINSSLDAIIAMFQSLARFFFKPITIDGSVMTVDNNRGITSIDEGLQFIIKYPSTDIESIKLDGIEGTFALTQYEELLEGNYYNVRYENGVFQPTSIPQISKNLSLDDILTNIDNIDTTNTALSDFLANKTISTDYSTQVTTLKDDLEGILNSFKALYIGPDYTKLREEYDSIETSNAEAVTENVNKGNILVTIGNMLVDKDTVNDSIITNLASLKTIHENEVLPVVGNIVPTLDAWKAKIDQMEALYKRLLDLNITVTDGTQRQLIDLVFAKAKQSYEKILNLYLETIDLDTTNTSDVNIDALETLRVSIENTKSELEAIVLPDYLDKELEDSTKLIATVVSDNETLLSDLQGRVATIVSDHQRIRSELGGDDRAALDAAVSKATQLQADIQSCMTTLSDNGITNIEFQKLKVISDNIGTLIDNTTLINDNHLAALENIDTANQILANLITAENRMSSLTTIVVNVQAKLNDANASKIEWQSYLDKCNALKKLPTEIEYIRQKLDLDAPFVFNNDSEKDTLSKVVIEHLIKLNNKKATLNIPTFKQGTTGSAGEVWQNTLFPEATNAPSVEGLQGASINSNVIDNNIEFVGSTGFVSGQISADGTMYIKLSDEFISEIHHVIPPTIKVLTSTGNILALGFISDYNITTYGNLAYDANVPVDGYYAKTVPVGTGEVSSIPGIDGGQTVTYLRSTFNDGDVVLIVSNNGSTDTIVGCQTDFTTFQHLLSGGICKLTCNSGGDGITIETTDSEFGLKTTLHYSSQRRLAFNGAIYTYNGPKTRISGAEVMGNQMASEKYNAGKMIIKAMSNGLSLTYDHELFRIEIHNFHNNTTRYIVLGDNPNWAKVTSFYLAQNETTLFYTMDDNYIYKTDGINAIPGFLDAGTYSLTPATLNAEQTDYKYVAYTSGDVYTYQTGDTYSIGDLITYDVVSVEEDDGAGGTVTNYYSDNIRRTTPPLLPYSRRIDAGVIGELLVDDDYVIHTDYTVASILNINYGELYAIGNVPENYRTPNYHVYGDGFQCYKGNLFIFDNHNEVHNLLLDKQIVFYENILERVKSGTIV